jgi:hypothetical protein
MRTPGPDSYDTYPPIVIGPTDSGSVLGAGSGPSNPTGPGANGGGIDFGSGSANPYLPVGSAPPPTTGGSSSGGTHTGTTHSGSSSTGSRHTSASSTAASEPSKSVPTPASGTTTRQKTVTTILTPHPVRVRFKATNDPGFPGGLPLHFIATAGITSHERRSHHPSAPHVNPHRRF